MLLQKLDDLSMNYFRGVEVTVANRRMCRFLFHSFGADPKLPVVPARTLIFHPEESSPCRLRALRTYLKNDELCRHREAILQLHALGLDMQHFDSTIATFL